MKLSYATATIFETPSIVLSTTRGARTPLRSVEVSPPRNAHEWQSAAHLIREFFAWIAERTGVDPHVVQDGIGEELDDLAGYYAEPRGRFFVARLDGEVVGTTGMRRMEEPGVVELKRVYIQPEARGHQLGAQLLEWALQSAREIGAHTVRLETAPLFMQNAVKLYRSYGFQEIENYTDLGNRVEGLLSMELRLRR